LFFSEQELKAIDAQFDAAIRQYETVYQQETSVNASVSDGQADSAYAYSENFPYLNQLTQAYDRALAESEETLQSLEQTPSYFDRSLRIFRNLERSEKEERLAELEYYLKGLRETAQQLAGSLEKSINVISEELEC
jgi:uncharacterized protein YukE